MYGAFFPNPCSSDNAAGVGFTNALVRAVVFVMLAELPASAARLPARKTNPRHSSRSRPLKLSMTPVSTGMAGRMNGNEGFSDHFKSGNWARIIEIFA